MPAPGVLVVLFDAMDQGLARRLAAEGRMPTLAGLLAEGSHAPTEPPDPFFVGGVWPAFATSVGASVHGLYCWRQFDPATYREPTAPFAYSGLEPFWQVLDRAGTRCLAFDVPRTFRVPLQHSVTIHDYLLHDPLPPGLVTEPPEVGEALRAGHGPPDDVPCDTWPRETDADLQAITERLHERMDRKVVALEALLEERAYDFAIVGFAESHCGGHQLWHIHDPGHPYHRDVSAAMPDPLERVYEDLDRTLARVLALTDAQTRVMCIMSHGMGPHYDGSHLLDDLIRMGESTLGPLRPLSLGERVMGWRPTRNLGALVRPSLRKRFRRWGYRAAFPVSNNEAWAGVRLNLAGRESRGRVPADGRAEAQERLIAFFQSVRHLPSGESAFARVLRVEDAVSPGPEVPMLPDVIAEWRRDLGPYHAVEVPGRGRIEIRDTAHRTGDHRSTGYAIVRGSDAPAGALTSSVSVCALAPTFASWLGVELPQAAEPPVAAWSPALAKKNG